MKFVMTTTIGDYECVQDIVLPIEADSEEELLVRLEETVTAIKKGVEQARAEAEPARLAYMEAARKLKNEPMDPAVVKAWQDAMEGINVFEFQLFGRQLYVDWFWDDGKFHAPTIMKLDDWFNQGKV
jgi:hypothetical protein